MRIGSLCLSLPLLAACHASVEVNAKAKTPHDEPEPPPSIDATEVAKKRTEHVGVVHNLSLTQQAAQTATCRCMAVALGSADDPAFQWRGTAPSVGDEAIVLGISGDGTPCDKPVGGRGPSIKAVEEEGGNVIVTIEEARHGIPLASGAIFRRPPGEGWVVFRAGRLPYADVPPGSNDTSCRLKLR